MRRRYREGAQLSKQAFFEQPWLCGLLTFEQREGRPRIGLWNSGPDANVQPLGLLWRPEIAACAYDTISFAGTEKIGARWFYQVWYCEIGGPPRE